MKKIISFIMIIASIFMITSCYHEEEISKVDQVIQDFLDNYAENYLTINSDNYDIDYNVVQGIKLLEKVDSKIKLSNYLSKEDAKKYLDSLDYNYVSNIFKASVIDKAYDMITEKAKQAVINLTEVDMWSINYCYAALNYYNVNEGLKSNLYELLQVVREEDYRDADYAGVTLAVTMKDTFDKTPLTNLIKDSITKGGVSSWGNTNAASTASSIIGLLAIGEDIDHNYLDDDGKTLLENLLLFEDHGAFKWLIDDEIDLNFSTPQGFLACVCYKVYQETNTKVEVF